MAEAPDIGGKDSSEDQDVPAKCQDNVGDNIVSDKDGENIITLEGVKIDVGDDVAKEEEEQNTDDEEYLIEQLEEAEAELKRWREKKRKTRSMRRDMDSDDEPGPEMVENDADSDDGGPDDDDRKNDALAFQRIIK